MKNTFFLMSLVLMTILSWTAPVMAQDSKIQAYQDAIKADPKNADAYFNLGFEYFNRKQFDLAADAFGKAERLNPKDSQAKELRVFSTAYLSYLQNDFGKALEGFKETLKINPKNPNAAKLLGAAYLQQKDYDSAEKAYQTYLTTFTDDKEAQLSGNMNLAKVYVVKKRYEDAVLCLQKVLVAQPKHFDALNNLGGAYFQLNKFVESADAWKKASASFRSDLSPEDKAGVYKYLGYSYYRLGKLQDAVDSYQKSLKYSPDDSDVLYNMGVADLDRGMYDEAADAFKRAFAKNPSDSNAALGQAQAIDSAINEHLEKGSSFMVNGEYSKAIGEWKKVLGYQADHAQAKQFIVDAQHGLDVEVNKLYDSGQVALKAGKSLEAVQQWNSALAMDPGNEKVKDAIRQVNLKTSVKVSSLASQGDDALAGGDYSGAIEMYRQALTAKPNDAAIKAKVAKAKAAQKLEYEKQFAVGERAETAGRYRESIQAFTKAVSADPSNVLAKQRLDNVRVRRSMRIEDLLKEGQAMMEGGNNKVAQGKFESVLALDPNNDKANDFIKKLTGQKSQVKVDADRAKKIYYEGVNLYINGKIEDAIIKWNECLKLDPGNANVTTNINKAKAKLQSIQKLKRG
jgi:tetratricopeptide (TPR) repeat protein